MRGPIKKLIIVNILAFTSLLFTSQAVFADSDLSISISSNSVHMDLTVGVFGTESQTITASTTNSAGYKIKLTTAGSSSALVNEQDSSKTIPTFTLPSGSSSIPVGSIGDGYGYSIDSGANYLPIPEPFATPAVLFQTTTAGSNNHALTFGVKVPVSTEPGNYSNSFNIIIVANLLPCPADSICYAGNDDDGTGTMADQSASSNSSVDLLASNFSRPGYGFAGWNTEPDGSGTNYGPNQAITTGDLSVTGLQLYAHWIRSSGTLQSWNGCSEMTAIRYDDTTGELIMGQNSITALTDSRDQNTYAVVKFADDHCWMIENLRLDLNKQDLSITNLNTNKPTGDFSTAVNTNHPASSNSFCANNNATCNNQILFNTNNTNRNLTASYDANTNSSSWYSYGNYYNWYTATAGNGTYGLSNEGSSAAGDICPANWRLPSGYGNVGDLAILDTTMGGTGANQTSGTAGGLAASKRWRAYPYNYILSGEYRSNAGYNRGTSSSYATINVVSATNTANLWLKPDGVHMNSNGTAKVRGQTVRCLFNPGYHVSGNIHYDANGGTGTMSDETNVDFSSAVAANNAFTRTHYQFTGWNTAADGSGVVVSEGGSVATAADRMGISEGQTLTLYATWRSVYSLVYDGNGADAGTMTNAKVNNLEPGRSRLVASNFSRTGYGFAGWSIDSSAGTKLANGQAVTIYGPNQSITVDNNFYANADQDNQITLYAVWIQADSNYTMQSFGSAQCNYMEFGEIIALTDTRNNDVYAVARLEDGNCWMIENLRLDPSTTTFTSSNTNSPTADFITAAPNSASSNTLCNGDNDTCINTIRFNTNALNRNLTPAHNNNSIDRSWYSYGVMYNWYTASAGNGTYNTSNTNVAGDICPVGWRLPTGGQNGEFVTLNNLANNGSTNSDSGFVKFPDNFIYSGDFNYDTPGGRNSYGRYWSATPDGNLNAYRLGIISSNPTPAGSYKKWDAFAVRCIKEGDEFMPDAVEYILDYDAGYFATDVPEDEATTSHNSSHRFTLSTSVIPHVFGYQFLGYSSANGDTTPEYAYDAATGTFTPSTITVDSTDETNTVTIYVVFQEDTCPADYICYFDNGADGGIGTMEDQPATSNSTATLTPPNYSKTGYGFAGWITSADAVPYGPNATINTGDLSSSGLKLYAKWIPSSGNLQNWNGCNSMTQGDITALTDIRDNQTYAVAKLGDEKCWTVENLRLDPGTATITSENTNNPDANFIEATNDNNTHSMNTLCNVRGPECLNQIQYNANSLNRTLTQSYTSNDAVSGWYSYGVYYNWYTATAGKGTFSTMEQSGPNHDGVIDGDICPAGWHLPTGGGGGEYNALNAIINNSSDSSDLVWRAYPNNFIWSGDYNNNKRSSSYSNGRIWTATTKDNDRSYRLGYAEGALQASSNSDNKWDGFAVRCVLSDTATEYNDVTVTLPQNVNNVTFTSNNYATATATGANNVVSLARGATYTITASIGSGYILDTWTAGANGFIGNSNQNPTTFTITDDTTLTLSVNQATSYTVTVNLDAGTSSVDFYHADYGTQTVTNNNGNGDGTTTTTINLYAGINYTITPNLSNGYSFGSWSTTSSGNLGSTSSATTSYSISGAATLSATSTSYLGPEPPASCNTPVPNITYMQQINTSNYTAVLGTLTTEQAYYLRDSRDGEPYCVSKLADGRLWMIDNLRLDLGDSNTLSNVTASNTNATAAQLQYLKNGGGTASDQYPTAGINSEAWVNSNQDYYSVPMSVSSGTCLNPGSCVNESDTEWTKDSTVTVYGNGSGKVGVLYNYCAASAGTYCYGNGTNKTNIPETDSNPSSYYDLDGDICPTGWRMPTGNTAGEIYGLYNYYGYRNASSPSSLQYKTSIPFAGSFMSGQLNSFPTYQGAIWTATRGNASNPQQFIVKQDTITMSNSLTHNYATAIRCILETPVHTVTVNFAGSGVSSVTISNPAYDAQTVTTSGGTVTLRHGISYTVTTTLSDADYGFVDYATTSNGSFDATTNNPANYVVTGNATLTATGEALNP
ncbi:InlB B-repeat-containing protein [Candidatus Saccharibacteria bacterium]|nr:InlB B-repeat-containing protein [Candidatus Saccharibacteria bacterium]